MPDELVTYILKYGYLAIFVFVFSQEVGLPNPVPNELVLIFSGYLIFMGILKMPVIILAAVLGDFTGTTILYTVFYFFGVYIFKHKPRWLPIPVKSIFKLKDWVTRNGLMGIYIGRLTPFIRGYTSVIAGLLQIKPRVFLPIGMITASIWATIYVTIGVLLGPFWSHVAPNISSIKYIMLLIFTTIILVIILRSIIKHRTAKDE